MAAALQVNKFVLPPMRLHCLGGGVGAAALSILLIGNEWAECSKCSDNHGFSWELIDPHHIITCLPSLTHQEYNDYS